MGDFITPDFAQTHIINEIYKLKNKYFCKTGKHTDTVSIIVSRKNEIKDQLANPISG